MKLTDLKKYKKILILGYGKEGQATEKFIKKYLPEATVGIADKKNNLNYLDEQKNYDLIIRSPGISKKLITKPYTTATNIFFANTSNIIIGVTGTKGKSTTASLIYSILKAAGKKVHLVGNIGLPMLEEMLKPIDKEDIFVAELSSYQLDDIKYSPHISVIINLFPEHMNYHGNSDIYYEAKKNILKFVKPDDYYCYNPKYSKLKQWAESIKCISYPSERIVHFDKVTNPLIGEHNLENIDEAVTVSKKIFNISDEIIKNTVRNFQPLPHRLQFIGKFKNILFYDDAISTTPESTICAINSFPKIGTIFLGGLDRGYDFDELSRVIIEKKIPNIVLFPDSGEKIFNLLNKSVAKFNILKTKSMEEAVSFAYKNTQPQSVCLLSTASPSYSLWKNFEEKGEQFQFFVKKLC